MGRRGGGGAIQRGDRVQEKELGFCFHTHSSYPFPSLISHPFMQPQWFIPNPPPSISPFLPCLIFSLSPSSPSPPSVFPSVLALFIWTWGCEGVKETQNQHTVLVLKFSAEAKGHCNSANDLNENMKAKRREKSVRFVFYNPSWTILHNHAHTTEFRVLMPKYTHLIKAA